MIEALALMLAINGVVFIAGCIAGRITAPPSEVTVDPYGNELPARFRAAEAHQFDMRPSAQVIPIRGGDAA